MTDNDAPDRQAEQEQQQQHSEHINEMLAGDGDGEFVYTETSKPINRNAVVLLLIALVGASMVYLMYLRGRFNADQQTSSDAEAVREGRRLDARCRREHQDLRGPTGRDRSETEADSGKARPGPGARGQSP